MRLKHVVVGMGILWLWTIAGGGENVYGQAALSSGSGQESSFRLGKDLSVTLGFDLWPNQWITTNLNPVVLNRRGVTEANITSQQAFSVGLIPTATLVYQRFFLSTSYMWTPDYDFGTSFNSFLNLNDPNDPNDTTFGFSKTETTASRQEVDVTLGYFPLDWLGVAIGYKGIFQEYETDTVFNDNLPLPPREKSTFNFNANGVILGVLTSAKIDDRFSLIGNVFGGYLIVSCSSETTPKPLDPVEGCSFGNSTYVASKVVLRYALNAQLAMTLGYRVQFLDTSINDEIRTRSGVVTKLHTDSDGFDITHGPILGVNYRF